MPPRLVLIDVRLPDIEAFSYLYPLADAALIRKMEGAEITSDRLDSVMKAHQGGLLVEQVFCAYLGTLPREDFPTLPEAGGATKPLHATLRLRHPHGAVRLELGVAAHEVAAATTVWRHHEAMVELQRAHLDGIEHVRVLSGGHR
mgnify:CR=1 FL=1